MIGSAPVARRRAAIAVAVMLPLLAVVLERVVSGVQVAERDAASALAPASHACGGAG